MEATTKPYKPKNLRGRLGTTKKRAHRVHLIPREEQHATGKILHILKRQLADVRVRVLAHRKHVALRARVGQLHLPRVFSCAICCACSLVLSRELLLAFSREACCARARACSRAFCSARALLHLALFHVSCCACARAPCCACTAVHVLLCMYCCAQVLSCILLCVSSCASCCARRQTVLQEEPFAFRNACRKSQGIALFPQVQVSLSCTTVESKKPGFGGIPPCAELPVWVPCESGWSPG